MASDIVNRMEGMEISNIMPASGHVLELEYPAIALLPNGVQPYIERPANVHHRQPPDPTLIPSNQPTKFYTIVEAHAPTAPRYSPSKEPSLKLIDAINSIKGLRGSSVLRVVAFRGFYTRRSNAMAVTYRFQLEVSSPYIFSGTQQVLQVDLDEDAWDTLLVLAEHEQWVNLVQDLVTRASDRAYFEVRSRLVETFGSEDYAIANDKGWQQLWMSNPPRNATELLMAHMKPFFHEDRAKWYTNCDGYVQVKFFGCGHIEYVRKIEVMAQTHESCLRAQCNSCSEPIITKKARRELELHEEVRKRDLYSWKNAMWRRMDEENFANDTKMYEFDSRMILEALDLALKSFSAPALVSPACLVPTVAYAIEITTIMQHLGGAYGRGSFETETGYGTIQAIVTPPGLMKFLALRLIRAINFLIHRRCSNRNYEHRAVHEHDDGWVYYSLSEEEKQYERKVCNVERLMKRMDLRKDDEEEGEVL